MKLTVALLTLSLSSVSAQGDGKKSAGLSSGMPMMMSVGGKKGAEVCEVPPFSYCSMGPLCSEPTTCDGNIRNGANTPSPEDCKVFCDTAVNGSFSYFQFNSEGQCVCFNECSIFSPTAMAFSFAVGDASCEALADFPATCDGSTTTTCQESGTMRCNNVGLEIRTEAPFLGEDGCAETCFSIPVMTMPQVTYYSFSEYNSEDVCRCLETCDLGAAPQGITYNIQAITNTNPGPGAMCPQLP